MESSTRYRSMGYGCGVEVVRCHGWGGRWEEEGVLGGAVVCVDKTQRRPQCQFSRERVISRSSLSLPHSDSHTARPHPHHTHSSLHTRPHANHQNHHRPSHPTPNHQPKHDDTALNFTHPNNAYRQSIVPIMFNLAK